MTEASSIFEEAENQLQLRHISTALNLFDSAERSGYDPDACAAHRWTCHALLGDFESAWNESDAIDGRRKPDPNRFWDGKSWHRQHVLIRCLHGLGDTLQFVRYAMLLRSRTASLTIEAQPALKRLLQESGIADRVITWGEPEPHWDGQMEIVELPRIFKTTLATIPAEVPYLLVNLERRRRRCSSLRVGLVWAAGSYNPARSIPLSALAPLCGISGTEFFSFQAGPEREDLVTCKLAVRDFYDESGCILETARRLLTMDLVITVDTMIAHLAGALGLPVWTMLPYAGDWRWMLDRPDSPWYPSMQLFRQPETRRWDSVIQQVGKKLRATASGIRIEDSVQPV